MLKGGRQPDVEPPVSACIIACSFGKENTMPNKIDQETARLPRRSVVLNSARLAVGLPLLAGVEPVAQAAPARQSAKTGPSTFTTTDGVEIYFKDWGRGQPVVLCHGWPLSSDSWESLAFELANNGYRVVAHDRRGHGRSSQPWNGNDMDHYADDLSQLITMLNLRDIILAGFSTGGGEVARYVGRHGTGRVAKLALVSAVPPLMVKTNDNPGGVPKEVFDKLREGSVRNRAQLYLDLASGPFYGFNRPGAQVSQGLVNWWCMQGMMGGHKNTYDSIKAFSETDFRNDLTKFDKPTLIVHGEDDQVVPFQVGGAASAKIVKQAKLISYPGAPHGLPDTHKERFNADFLAFAKSK
jgi:non-heme chloroperoxidase